MLKARGLRRSWAVRVFVGATQVASFCLYGRSGLVLVLVVIAMLAKTVTLPRQVQAVENEALDVHHLRQALDGNKARPWGGGRRVRP